jgi:hypothetical protein
MRRDASYQSFLFGFGWRAYSETITEELICSIICLVGANPEHRPERSKTGKGGDECNKRHNKYSYSQARAHVHKKANDSQDHCDNEP